MLRGKNSVSCLCQPLKPIHSINASVADTKEPMTALKMPATPPLDQAHEGLRQNASGEVLCVA